MIVVPSNRDFFLARCAAARSSAAAMIDAIDEMVALCMDGDEDLKLRERKEALGEALELAGATSRALECAEEMIDRVDPKEIEPWDTEEAEEDDEEDDEPLPRATARKRSRG